ncbi:MAG: hypothetical protein HC925_08440 [Coleofasciculaceae cyanobacterium SM2_3_26]|nr:hypothetical protein [Coleofasciculaceae cyanobacterium SM2_3_26]
MLPVPPSSNAFSLSDAATLPSPPTTLHPTSVNVSERQYAAVLVDDFEDGNRFNEFRGTWFTYSDRSYNGTSQVIPESYSRFEPVESGAPGSQRSARITGKVSTDYDRGFVGIGTELNAPNDPVDISNYDGIVFWARGDGKTYRLKLRSTAVPDEDDYGYNFTPTAEWRQYVIPFKKLRQEGWGKSIRRRRALQQVTGIHWETIGQPHQSIDLSIDDISFTKAP